MIEIKNLNFGAGDNPEIIKNLSIKFPKNKITAITGANGSGKSTLVKLIMGINTPTSGSIFYNGENITNLPIETRAKMGISIAFQQPISFKGITVKKMIELASGKNLTVGDACKYLSAVGLCARDYVDRELSSSLSGGEMKRIELAICLAKGGNVFLFDEPEAGIDLWSFDSLVKIFESLKGKTVIIVSHQQKILDIADNILLLNKNGDCYFGKREDIQKIMHKESKCSVLEARK